METDGRVADRLHPGVRIRHRVVEPGVDLGECAHDVAMLVV
jgi:hypothetical protein